MSTATRHHVPPLLLERARAMRHEPAPAEQKLWWCLRNRKLCGLKFRRQQPLGRYVADFFCAQAKLVIELDGASHFARQQYDFVRTQRLNRDGWDVIRFMNADVHDSLDSVLEQILLECEQRIGALPIPETYPSPRPSPTRGEGEIR